MKKLLIVAGLLSAAVMTTTPAKASDWGCEVLLCAASQNPSWHSVQQCLPPMHRLISEMRRPGFSWPTCPGAGTGRPGFERHEECPEGWQPAMDPGADRSNGQNHCSRTVNTCGGQFSHRDDCQQVEYQPRPVRADPYYFDIQQAEGGTIRHWFNLNLRR